MAPSPIDRDVNGRASSAIPRDVKVFGAASFFTDVASDMVRPLLPLFVSQVLRGGGVELGLIEGSADAASSLLKLVSGRWNDRLRGASNEGWRKWLIVAGYTIAAVARPLTAVATAPVHVLATRVGDRIGKGIRTAPRDAWIADVTAPAARARAYGLHRALDNAGAFVGPLVALALLLLARLDLRTVIALSAVPAAIAIVTLVVGLRSKRGDATAPAPTEEATAADAPRERWPGSLRRFLAVGTILTLANASQGFLLLRAGDVGLSTWMVLLVWTGHSGLAAVLNVPLSTLSNRIGLKTTIAAGWITLAAAQAGFAASSTPATIIACFALYAVYLALTEGAERTLVATLAPDHARGRVFGAYHALVGGAQLVGNLAFGWVWDRFSPGTAFAASSAVAIAALLGFVLLVPVARTSLHD